MVVAESRTESHIARTQILSLPLSSWATLGKLLDISVPQFHHLENRDSHHKSCPVELLCRLNESVFIRRAQHHGEQREGVFFSDITAEFTGHPL